MAKSIKQRKDELLAILQAKLNEPVRIETSAPANLFEEYRKILYSNGIKNKKVIAAQLPKMIEANMPKPTVYSNLKFLTLLRSRLTEEGVPLADAEEILAHVEFNMHDVNEDDDYIGTFALHFAEICAKRYTAIFGQNVTKAQFVGDNLKLAETFNVMKVQLPAP